MATTGIANALGRVAAAPRGTASAPRRIRPRFGGERRERSETKPAPRREPESFAASAASRRRRAMAANSGRCGARRSGARPPRALRLRRRPSRCPAKRRLPPAPPPAASSQAATPSYQAPAPGQVRLYLNLGRKDGISTEEIVSLLASTGVSVPATSIDTMNTPHLHHVDAADGEKAVRWLGRQGTQRARHHVRARASAPGGGRAARRRWRGEADGAENTVVEGHRQQPAFLNVRDDLRSPLWLVGPQDTGHEDVRMQDGAKSVGRHGKLAAGLLEDADDRCARGGTNTETVFPDVV